MPKTPNAAAATQLDERFCNEPLIIVDVHWGDSSPVGVYADRDFGPAQGKILSLSGLDSLVRIGRAGASGNLNITLDDTDGSIKAILDVTDVHKRRVKVYQAFAEIDFTDRFLLLTGEINTPINYDHTSKTISFSIVSIVEGREIGFSPEQGDLDELGNVAESAIGRAWPLCFGNPVKVPAVKLTERVRGTSLTRYGLITIQEAEDLCDRAQTYEETLLLKEAADTNPGFSDDNYGVRINNVSAAAESLYTLLESLINDSPTLESLLRNYVSNCRELYRKQQEFQQTAAQLDSTQDQINALATTTVSLQQQVLIAEQNVANNIDVDANQQLLNGIPPTYDWVDIGIPPDEFFVWQIVSPGTDGLYTQLSNASTNLLALGILAGVLQGDLADLETAIDILEAAIESQKRNLIKFVISEIVVDGGENFPQGEEIQIVINGLYFRGTFSSRTFTVLEANLPADFGISTGIVANAPNQFQITTSPTPPVKGKYCFFPSRGVVLVTDQIGDRALYQPLIWRQVGALPPLEGVLVNGQPVIREIYDIDSLATVISETSVVIRQQWVDNLLAVKPDWANGLARISNRDYSIEVGDEVYLAEDYRDVYVANLIPSTEVKEVFAYRRIDGGVRRLLPVPSRYYSVELSASLAGQTPTLITFDRPLTEYVDENWEEDIYVTLVSSEGPNTSDVLAYLISNYTNLTPDAATFASVATAIDSYPSHFALLNKEQALPTIEDIAFQARCAVLVRDETAFIKYLAAEDAAIKTISEGVVESGSLALEFGETERLVTRLTGNWRTNYAAEEPNRVIIRNNVPKYGLLEDEIDVYIYNSESFVVKTVTYWMLQWSNTWKYIRFSAFLNNLILDPEDTVDVVFADDFVATGTVKGRVKEVDYNSEDQTVTFLIWTAVRSGEMAEYPFAFPATATLSLEYPTPDDPFAGS
jgi:hypothetical protein